MAFLDIMAMDQSIAEEPKYVVYKLTTNFVDLAVQKRQLKIFLNTQLGPGRVSLYDRK